MDNEELIRILDGDQLLSVAEFLCRCLMYPDDDFEELGYNFCVVSDEVFDYCTELTNYQRLKLMQQIINTLVIEAEKPAIQHFQTLLPLRIEA